MMHFNSHAHVERDLDFALKICTKSISTHTLTWSVTALNGNYGGYPNISTHTLTWSVTICSSTTGNRLAISTHTLTWSVTEELAEILDECYFNSHAHVERDAFILAEIGRVWISTHTLTWSVTDSMTSARLINRISTHTLTWSVTHLTFSQNFMIALFQLTRSRGA